MNDSEITPQFNELKDLNDHHALKAGILKDLARTETVNQNDILKRLLNELEPLDFELLAFPEVKGLRAKLNDPKVSKEEASNARKQFSKVKVSPKQYRILSIRNLLKVAQKNKWGLCKNHDFIYLYDGKFWSNIDSDAFQKFLGLAAEEMGVKWDHAQDYQFIDMLYKQFLSSAYLPAPKISKGKVLINLMNGTFEIDKDGFRLRDFDPADFITYKLPFDYDPEANCPRFEAYLNRVLPDEESQKVLAEYLGYVFIKNGSMILKEEKALILYGTGANGKSVFFEIVNALIGSENISNYSLQSLTNDNGYYRAKLANRLVNYASEINGSLEASIFKQLVSGEPVEARLPYGEPFTLTEYAKLIFNCNELPKDVENSHAFFRRFLIIPFNQTIPESEQDKQLSFKIIDEELSGVFNWVLRGLRRLTEQNKFSQCEAAREALEQYKIESNSVRLFLDENGYKSSPTNYRLSKDLYIDYKIFCNEDGMKPFNKKNFNKQLKSMGFNAARINQGNVVYLEAVRVSL